MLLNARAVAVFYWPWRSAAKVTRLVALCSNDDVGCQDQWASLHGYILHTSLVGQVCLLGSDFILGIKKWKAASSTARQTKHYLVTVVCQEPTNCDTQHKVMV